MSRAGAALFTWLQHAPFYDEAHRDAVALLPDGWGRRWLDVGCGPGLVTRLAAERGYVAMGVDPDEAMLRAARRSSGTAACRYECGGLDDLASHPQYDVVSATSLLCTVTDPERALLQLWSRVAPGGTLLIVETTSAMTPANVRRVVGTDDVVAHPALKMWAVVRRGRHVDRSVLHSVSAAGHRCVPLLGGLVQAWLLTRTASA